VAVALLRGLLRPALGEKVNYINAPAGARHRRDPDQGVEDR